MVVRQAESDYVALWYPWTTIPRGGCSRADTAKGAITIKSLIKGEIWKSFFGLGLQSLWHSRRETYSSWKRWLEMASNPSCAKIHAQKKKKKVLLWVCVLSKTFPCVKLQLLWQPGAAAHWPVFLRKTRVDVYGWEFSTALEKKGAQHVFKCQVFILCLGGNKFSDAPWSSAFCVRPSNYL